MLPGECLALWAASLSQPQRTLGPSECSSPALTGFLLRLAYAKDKGIEIVTAGVLASYRNGPDRSKDRPPEQRFRGVLFPRLHRSLKATT
jgi:hypothetical protein